MNRDYWARLSATDRCVAAGAAIVFIAGFLPWWGYRGPLALYGASVAGWSSGFTAWAGIILLVAAGAFHTARALGVSVPELRVGPAVAVAGAVELAAAVSAFRRSGEPVPWAPPDQT
jgi:hypothetical protein